MTLLLPPLARAVWMPTQALWRAKHETGTPLPQESVLQNWYERMKPSDDFKLDSSTAGSSGHQLAGGAKPLKTTSPARALSPTKTARNTSGSQSSALGADFFTMLHQR